MIVGPDDAGWPVSRLGDLLRELTSRSGWGGGRPVENPPATFDGADAQRVELFLETASAWLGVEPEPTQVSYGEVDEFLARGGPAVVRLRVGSEFRFLGLLGSSRARIRLVTPEGEVAKVPRATVRGWICARVEDPIEAEVSAFLRSAGVAARREEKARREVMKQRLGGSLLGAMWMIRRSAGDSFLRQLREVGVLSRVALLCVCHAGQYGLFLLSWWMVGRAALEGHADPGWLWAWLLLLLSIVPARMATVWLQGVVSVRAGALLKQRLLAGAMRLEPEQIRSQGAGQLLGRVLESEALESLSLGGGFLLVLGGIELAMASWVLSQGAAGLIHVGVVAAWAGVAALVVWRHYRHREVWTTSRLDMTHALIENMLGYRTRIAQEAREDWHTAEDRELERYVGTSVAMDRLATLLLSLLARGWLVVGILVLASVMAFARVPMVPLAISIGGILLAYRAFGSIAGGAAQLFGATIAWRSARQMFDAAAREEPRSSPTVAVSRTSEEGPLLEARDVAYAYPGRIDPILQGCNFEMKAGDRVLLQGPSGGGKSTLAALLAGLRRPVSGLLMLGGLDQQSTGLRRWRRSVVLVPQFHENHILSESLAFNLLMGRRWPAVPAELAEAEQVCRDLGLGDLLDRMPGGIFQMVGDTGWQLSHGERNRVFLARTLLQNEGLTILDECFEPLDSANALQASKLVLERTRSILAIAHS